CLLGPSLMLLTKRSLFLCAHACMVTMAHGEMVLLAGAALNVLLFGVIGLSGESALSIGIGLNVAVVLISNIVMDASLALQLRATGVPIWRTLTAWIVVLDGSWAVFGTIGFQWSLG
ncbi:MAG: hypothetical protein N2C14_06650, partial [Planctomycetales bacterium]